MHADDGGGYEARDFRVFGGVKMLFMHVYECHASPILRFVFAAEPRKLGRHINERKKTKTEDKTSTIRGNVENERE